MAAALVHHPGQLAALCAALRQCFAFDGTGARLLLFAVPEGGAYLPPPSAAGLLPGSRSDPDPDPTPSTAEEAGEAGQPRAASEGAPRAIAAPAVLLPRMPVGLALAADPRTYQALASVARGAGRMAAAAGAAQHPPRQVVCGLVLSSATM